MIRPLLACFAALCVFAAHAQDPQKPAAEADRPASEGAKPEAAKPEAAPEPERGPGMEPDPKIMEDLFGCIAEGLPKDWKKAWFVVREIGRTSDREATTRSYAADFAYSTDARAAKGRPLKPCGVERVIQGVAAMNEYLTDQQRLWTAATFTFLSDGKFDIKYDYTPLKKPAAKPAARPAAKPAAKKAESK